MYIEIRDVDVIIYNIHVYIYIYIYIYMLFDPRIGTHSSRKMTR